MSETIYDALTDLQVRIGEANAKSGFHQLDEVPTENAHLYWANKLLLVVSEVIEAHDELRHGKNIDEVYYPTSPDNTFEETKLDTSLTLDQAVGSVLHKPEGPFTEIADAIIRLFGIAAEAGVDLPALILEKITFNETRSFRHGGKRF